LALSLIKKSGCDSQQPGNAMDGTLSAIHENASHENYDALYTATRARSIFRLRFSPKVRR